MGHYCGVPNRSAGGSCRRWLVNVPRCADHRRRAAAPTGPGRARPLSAALGRARQNRLRALAVGYLGTSGVRRLHQRRGNDCRPLADAARAIATRQLQIHAATGDAVTELLPPSTPGYVRTITARVVQRVPHAWANVDGVIRALQVTGILVCAARHLPPVACPCLMQVVAETGDDSVRGAVDALLADATMDLREILPGAA